MATFENVNFLEITRFRLLVFFRLGVVQENFSELRRCQGALLYILDIVKLLWNFDWGRVNDNEVVCLNLVWIVQFGSSNRKVEFGITAFVVVRLWCTWY